MNIFDNLSQLTENILTKEINNFEYEPGEIINELFLKKYENNLDFKERVSQMHPIYEDTTLINLPVFKRIRQSLTKNNK